jgi:hypothetical protein
MSLFKRALLGEPGGVKRLWSWAPLSMGLVGKLERGLIFWGLMCGRRFWDGCLSL